MTIKGVNEMKKELIELIERDTPKKVYSTDYHYCPNCDTHYLIKYQNFCDYCGQRLDWSENKLEKEEQE